MGSKNKRWIYVSVQDICKTFDLCCVCISENGLCLGLTYSSSSLQTENGAPLLVEWCIFIVDLMDVWDLKYTLVIFSFYFQIKKL